MPNISTKELEIKWNESQKQINTLLQKDDTLTKNMLNIHKIYINNPYNESTKDLFEYTFYGWYKNNVKG